jgi:lysophospholipase L1-like esterase
LAAITGRPPASSLGYELRTADSGLEHIAVISDSYTTGSTEGGNGPQTWTVRAWQALRSQGVQVAADVAAEGWAGYSERGNYGHNFQDLGARAIYPDDALVVFFGSRNDQGVDPAMLTGTSRSAFDFARRIAPSANLLVIGPACPTADVPGPVLQIRDILQAQAWGVGAIFADPIAEGWFVGRPELIGADQVHPTDAGHAYMAEKIAPLIQAQLTMIRT